MNKKLRILNCLRSRIAHSLAQVCIKVNNRHTYAISSS